MMDALGYQKHHGRKENYDGPGLALLLLLAKGGSVETLVALTDFPVTAVGLLGACVLDLVEADIALEAAVEEAANVSSEGLWGVWKGLERGALAPTIARLDAVFRSMTGRSG